jgi:hypothetical protein
MSTQPSLSSANVLLGRGVRIPVLALLVLETLLVGLLYVPIPPSPDQEQLDYMAWSALTEGGLYRNATDVNLPGEPLLHIVSLSVFGNHYWSYRMQDYLLLVGFSAAMGLLARPHYGKLFAMLFYGIYLLIYTTAGYWMSGQRDLLATHAILLAGFAYLRRSKNGHPVWLLVCGVGCALAVLLKPTFAVFPPLLLASVEWSVRRPMREVGVDALACAAIGASTLGFVVLLGWMTNSLQAFYDTVVVFSSQSYAGGIGFVNIALKMVDYAAKSWHWLSLMAVSGAVCWTFEKERSPLSVLFAVFISVLVSTFAQSKGFGYHFAGLLTLMGLLTAFYLAEVVRFSVRIEEPRLRYAVLSFPVLIVASGLSSKARTEFGPQVAWYLDRSRFDEMLRSRHFDDVLATSQFVRSSTRPGQWVWPLTRHIMISSLADRAIPSPLVQPYFLRASKPTPFQDEWHRDVRRVFKDRPPEIVVLEEDPRGTVGIYQYMDAIRPDEPMAAFKDALDCLYVRDRRIGRFVCFRKSRESSPPTSTTELGSRVRPEAVP